MTTSFDPAPEPDDRPATIAPVAPVPTPALGPYRPRPSRWATVFRWWLGLSVLSFMAVALFAFVAYGLMDFAPLNIVIDGHDVSNGITITGLNEGTRAALAVCLVFLVLFMLLLIPLLLLIVIGAVAIAVVCGIGVPLIALAVALVAATSPFWMVGLLVWLIVRRRDSQRPAPSATMAA